MTQEDPQDVPNLASGDKVELGSPAGGDQKDGKKKCGC